MKRIILISLICLACTGLLGGYFFHVGQLADRKSMRNICKKVDITILNPGSDGVLKKALLYDMINPHSIGMRSDSINLHSIEKELGELGDVSHIEAYVSDPATLKISVSQRKPVVRFDRHGGSYYSDSEGFVFPVTGNVDVPRIKSELPLEKNWVSKAIGLAGFISADEYWKKHVSNMETSADGELSFIMDTDNLKVLFGQCEDIEEKFLNLERYYRNIAPSTGDGRYSTVILKYRKQIICR